MTEPREERCSVCGGREAQVGPIQRHEITGRVAMGTIFGRENTIDVCDRHHQLLDGRLNVAAPWMRIAPAKDAQCLICSAPIFNTRQYIEGESRYDHNGDPLDIEYWVEFSCDLGHIFEWRGTGVEEEVPF